MSEPNPNRDHNNPTAGLRLPAPLTNAQLDALRPQAVDVRSAPSTAAQLAYKSGIKELQPLVERVEELERTVAWLKAEYVRLAAPRV